MSFKSLIAALPRGSEWSYAVTLSGIPDVFSDGKADWSSMPGRVTDRSGCLVSRDLSITSKSDPQNPLVMSGGGGPDFKLIDDGTDYIHELFSESNEGAWSYITQNLTAAAASTTINVQDSSVFTVNQYAYLGPETVKITAKPTGTSLTVTRAQFDTVRRAFTASNQIGMKLTSKPSMMRGRYIEVWAALIDQLTNTISFPATPVWAGMLADVSTEGEVITLKTESFEKVLTAAWPTQLPMGTLWQGQDSVLMKLNGWSFTLKWTDKSGVTAGENYQDLDLGSFDSNGVFTKITPVAGRFAMTYLVKCLQDTLNNYFNTTLISPWYGTTTLVRYFRNSIAMSVNHVDERLNITCSFVQTLVLGGEAAGTPVPGGVDPAGTADVSAIQIVHCSFLWVRDVIYLGNTNNMVGTWGPNYFVIDRYDDSIPVYNDNLSYPFTTSVKLADGTNWGFARIQSNDQWEIVMFSSVTTDTTDSKIQTLTGLVRGLGGSEPRKWGLVDGRPTGATVSQILMLGTPSGNVTPLRFDEVVATLLMSTEDYSQQGATYDRLFGKGMGLQIPARYVDYERFRYLQTQGNLLQVNHFWIDEKQKGKDSLTEYLKLQGICLVQRRFTRAGVEYFGISADAIDPPVVSMTFDTVTDDDWAANTKAKVTRNERLILNSLTCRPYFERWGDKDSDGAPITIFDQWSIERYGASKTLELKPTAIFMLYNNSTTGKSYEGRQAQLAWMEVIGYRWFGAFNKGLYYLDLECVAPAGWRFQMGDKVLVTITGIRNSNGSRGLTAVPARISECTTEFGSKASAKVRLQIGYQNFCELAPNGAVAALTATTLTLAANTYSVSTDPIPGTGLIGATDADWFDPSKYRGSIRCSMWNVGKWATTVTTFKVTARAGNVLTVDTNMTGTLAGTNFSGGAPTLIAFNTYSTALNTVRQNSYCHAADNGSPPNISGGTMKEYR